MGAPCLKFADVFQAVPKGTKSRDEYFNGPVCPDSRIADSFCHRIVAARPRPFYNLGA
jgi:hypothetical protein